MTQKMDEYHFDHLLKMIFNHVGLDCTHYKPSYLKRRLAVRMRATKMGNYGEYERLLSKNKEEYELLLDRLTINVSQFFRDTSVFQEMKKKIIPILSQKKHVKVWSAGCANGEEPYTLAMLFDHEMPKSVFWEIVATDIDPNCLARAKAGIYKSQAVVDVPPEFKARYLEQKEEQWHVKNVLKSKIKFKIYDLTGKMTYEKYDMILCRNVLIYFMPKLQELLFAGFRDVLQPEGFLVLGKTETLLGETRNRFNSLNGRERIYQVKPKDQLPAVGDRAIG